MTCSVNDTCTVRCLSGEACTRLDITTYGTLYLRCGLNINGADCPTLSGNVNQVYYINDTPIPTSEPTDAFISESTNEARINSSTANINETTSIQTTNIEILNTVLVSTTSTTSTLYNNIANQSVITTAGTKSSKGYNVGGWCCLFLCFVSLFNYYNICFIQ